MIAGKVREPLPTQASSMGGSADTGQTAVVVRPRGMPSPPMAATTATPAGMEVKMLRNKSASIVMVYLLPDPAATEVLTSAMSSFGVSISVSAGGL
jgi:hypothetical protein